MKKKSKGFTLIELLAIIVILAIIAVITVPIILDVIDNAKRGSIKDSAYGYKDAVNKYYVSELYDNQNLKLNGDYTINDKGELSDGTNTHVIPFSGTTPTGGNLTYENNVLKNGCITIDEYKATIENGEVTTVEKGSCDGSTTQTAYKCIRATKLHEEACQGFCISSEYGEGYDTGEIIEFGKLGTKGAEPVSGDAFDCDVNGDGTYSPETERFYYVSDLYDATTKQFDSEYAVLLYSNTTVEGKVNNTTTIAYDSTHGSNVNQNWHGPLTAKTHLPLSSDWKNVSLKSTSRQILNENEELKSGNGLNDLPLFSYEGYAARLLTTQELNEGCGLTLDLYENADLGALETTLNSRCIYMLENTMFSNDDLHSGFWLETPSATLSDAVFVVDGDFRGLYRAKVTSSGSLYSSAVRPVIEVKMTDIDY